MREKPIMPMVYNNQDEDVTSVMLEFEEHRKAQVIKGTLEKPLIIKELMELAFNVIQRYLESQGFSVSLDIQSILNRTYMVSGDKIHLQTRNGQDIIFPLYAAAFDAIADKIFIKKEIKDMGESFMFRVLAHELVHLFQTNYLRAHKSKSGRIHLQKRGGYALDTLVHNIKDNTVSSIGGKLAGLNEALTDLIVISAIEFSEIMDQDDLSHLFWDSYEEEKITFMAIVKRISGVENKSYEEVEREFIKGYISGNMMHLRKVEKFFGKNALKVLAKLGTFSLQDPKSQSMNLLIAQFFETQDPEERDRISQSILG